MSGKRNSPQLLPSVLWKILPIGVLLIMAVSFLAHSQVNRVFEEELNLKLERETEFAAQQIDASIESLHDIIATLGVNDLIINALVDETMRVASTRPLIQGMTIATVPEAKIGFTDYRGRLIASNHGADEFPAKQWIKSVMAGSRYTGIDSQFVTLAVPVFYKGRPEGAIFLKFDTPTLASFISAPYLADAHALRLNGAEISKTVTAPGTDWDSGRPTDGWITSTARSLRIPGLELVVAGQSDRVFAPLAALDQFLVGVAAANLAVLVFGLALTAALVARPLARFAEELAGVHEAEDLHHRVNTQGYSEIAAVADSFNAMLERLDGAMVSHDLLLAENREREKAERELLDQRAELVAVFETVVDGIVTIEGNGVIRTVNQAVSKIFGYEPDELIGKNVSMLMPSSHAARHDSYIRNFNETGDAKIIGIGRELEAVKKNGDTFPIELFISKMEVMGQNLFVGVVRDITERTKIDTMKREFVSVVSHELRTPLTAMIGALGLVNSGSFGELPEKTGSLLQLAQNNAKRLVELVNDILDIDKLESGRVELTLAETDLVELVRQAYTDNLPYAAQCGVHFQIEEPDHPIIAMVDGRRLSQVLANLLSNAAKFSDENDTVTIAIRSDGGTARIAVTDSGPGIPEDSIQKIFGKFYQVDSTDTRGGQGTGLGLAISQAIAMNHNSELKVESTPGEGSTFYFDLPVISHDTVPAEQANPDPVAVSA